MSKYDFELDLKTNNTMKLINELILPDTEVLEFGCAYGRLTKYLKEQKKCKVKIVEIDEEAGKIASQYAEDSYIGKDTGDIEKYIWSEKIETKFDYIIFADVLEHLYYPEKVLEKCKQFLKQDGSIIVSIPNIAHNSIIIELIKNRFNYQRTGLLDDTHIRFFTNESFNNMLCKIDLVKFKEFATYSKVGENEFNNNFRQISPYVAKELIKRPSGNVYQYVYEIKNINLQNNIRCESNIDEYEFCNYYFSVFYTNNSEQIFEESSFLRKKYIPEENINNKMEFKFEKELYIDKLRIDPIESNCVIKINNIEGSYKGEKFKILISQSNADLVINNIYFFITEDPQLISESINRYAEKIIIDFEIMEYEVYNKDKYDLLKYEMDNRRIIIEQKENYISEQRAIIEQKENYISEQRAIIEQKENYINEQRAIIEQKENYINEQRATIEQKENYTSDLREELNKIQSSKYFKVYQKVKKVLGRKS